MLFLWCITILEKKENKVPCFSMHIFTIYNILNKSLPHLVFYSSFCIGFINFQGKKKCELSAVTGIDRVWFIRLIQLIISHAILRLALYLMIALERGTKTSCFFFNIKL